MNRDHNFPLDIVQILDTRNFWGKMFRQTRTELSAQKYKEFQELATQKISEFKLKNWENFVKRQGKNPLSSAPFWKRIGRLRSNKRRKRLNSLIIDNQVTTDTKAMAEAFANDLESKFKLDENERFNGENRVSLENFF